KRVERQLAQEVVEHLLWRPKHGAVGALDSQRRCHLVAVLLPIERARHDQLAEVEPDTRLRRAGPDRCGLDVGAARERPPDRVEHARLAGTVASGDLDEVAVGGDLDGNESLDVLGLQGKDLHRSPASSASRSSMYFASSATGISTSASAYSPVISSH